MEEPLLAAARCKVSPRQLRGGRHRAGRVWPGGLTGRVMESGSSIAVEPPDDRDEPADGGARIVRLVTSRLPPCFPDGHTKLSAGDARAFHATGTTRQGSSTT